MKPKQIFLSVFTALNMIMLAGCNNPESIIVSGNAPATSGTTSSVTSTAQTQQTTEAEESETVNVDQPQETTTTVSEAEETRETTTTTVSKTEETQPEEELPRWTETAVSGQRYVSKDNIYARIYAIQGSQTVRQYRLNDLVTIVARTDTGYYKLDDGSFIHGDYLSETELPRWTETAVNGQRYVSKDGIYARIYAIQGSQTVRQYRLNDLVTVVARTDTGYYKLDDGSFIHGDYLSETEIIISNTENADYVSTTSKGYVIERIGGITYVDGIMIANKTFTLPANYDPGIKREAADALAKMQSAAKADGIILTVVSGYRSYYTQVQTYAGWVNRYGAAVADTLSSRPGYSDHQTGYTYDLNSTWSSFAYTPEGIWLAEHCAEYGFIVRYPEGKDEYTGYMYEPWHVRWIGVEKAKAITESGLSLEEYYGIPSSYDISGDVFA